MTRNILHGMLLPPDLISVHLGMAREVTADQTHLGDNHIHRKDNILDLWRVGTMLMILIIMKMLDTF